jgi:hypothetical protein
MAHGGGQGRRALDPPPPNHRCSLGGAIQLSCFFQVHGRGVNIQNKQKSNLALAWISISQQAEKFSNTVIPQEQRHRSNIISMP